MIRLVCLTIALMVLAPRGTAAYSVLAHESNIDALWDSQIRPALLAWGAKLDFWKVAVKPGKPIMVASRGVQLVVGLPGNPVSSHVTAFHFLLPLLRALAGATHPLPRSIMARAGEDLLPGGPRQEFLRAHWDGCQVSVRINQDSGALATLAASNALIDRPASAPAVTAGEAVSVFLLDNGGMA